MDDAILKECNETELLSLARAQGLGRLRRGIPKETLIAIVRGETDPLPDHFCGTAETRERLQKAIFQNYERARSQLPGCDGRCTTFPCSDGRHALCLSGNVDTVR